MLITERNVYLASPTSNLARLCNRPIILFDHGLRGTLEYKITERETLTLALFACIVLSFEPLF